jgi:pyruvate/2-oxoglutarate dehydrogenase complex dihydrolipoamide acyltransferase (E2) component
MAVIEVKVPNLGDFKDVEIIEVHVAVGDTIRPEATLVTLETDKAAMEVPSSDPQAGRRGGQRTGEAVRHCARQ